MDAQMESIIARRSEVVGRVKDLLIESLNLDLEPDEIAEDSALFGFGLGLDSIDALTLIVGIEDRFELAVPDSTIHVFRSVNTVADFVMSKMSDYGN